MVVVLAREVELENIKRDNVVDADDKKRDLLEVKWTEEADASTSCLGCFSDKRVVTR